MKNEETIKKEVQAKYASLAVLNTTQKKSSCCCGSNKPDNSGADFVIMADEYEAIPGYVPEADLKLGCGVPTEHAGIKEGDTVLDLGSGAGNDVFVVRQIVGESGKVIGLDMTPEMIALANKNNAKLGYNNIEFVLGEIEEIPLQDELVDVIISNCVLNLVPNKTKTFSEIYRVLKPGAHFCVSDIVVLGEMPDRLRNEAALYAGCISGAVKKDEYIAEIEKAGFKNIQIKGTKDIVIPESVVRNVTTEEEFDEYRRGNVKLESITVVAYK